MEKKPVNLQIQPSILIQCRYQLGKPESGKTYSISMSDEVAVENFTETSFSLLFSRKSITNDAFEIEVTYQTEIRVIDPKQLVENEESIVQYAERVKRYLASMLVLPARAAALIADITRETGNPFISSAIITATK